MFMIEGVEMERTVIASQVGRYKNVYKPLTKATVAHYQNQS